MKTNIQDLKAQQSEYLEKYFEGVNEYYNKLGNRDFEINMKTDDRGDKKVYYLDVVLKGKSLTEEEMSKLMSESEKRSLALAVFLSKLEQEDEKETKIVVLDDPVVSFDANRCTSTIDIVKNLLSEYQQVIIFSHYALFVEDLFTKVRSNSVFLHLKRNATTAYLDALQESDFLNSPLNKAMKNIITFISRGHDNNILDDCRILMEKYLVTRYMQTMLDKNISSKQGLCLLIDELKDAGAFDESTAKDLHNKRENLNPSHHDFTDGSRTEDSRTYAQEVLNLLNSL